MRDLNLQEREVSSRSHLCTLENCYWLWIKSKLHIPSKYVTSDLCYSSTILFLKKKVKCYDIYLGEKGKEDTIPHKWSRQFSVSTCGSQRSSSGWKAWGPILSPSDLSSWPQFPLSREPRLCREFQASLTSSEALPTQTQTEDNKHTPPPMEHIAHYTFPCFPPSVIPELKTTVTNPLIGDLFSVSTLQFSIIHELPSQNVWRR